MAGAQREERGKRYSDTVAVNVYCRRTERGVEGKI
jgi:hypothetical protein